MIRAIALLSSVLCGCAASIPADPTRMSPDQLREWAKDRNASIACTVVNSPYGRGVMTYVTLDKAVIIDGSLTLDNECKVAITNAPKAVATAPAVLSTAPLPAKPMNCYPGNKEGTVMVCER